ncbi:MAG: 50S ribosomal protein L4 [Candidatus Saccharibacteria bacterium]
MKAATFSKNGTKAAETVLPKAVFEAEVTEVTLQQAVVRANANLRHANAKTLTRAEVRGGGRKPWRQKGTGRARFGSTRVPIWRSGGVAHGPHGEQNYTKDMPKNMVHASVRMALTTQANTVIVVEKFEVKEPKTRLAIDLIDKLNAEGNVIIISSALSEPTLLALANVPGVMAIRPTQLRAYDVMIADTIIIEKPALSDLEKQYGKATKQPAAMKGSK